jgi:hypothetical protein
MAPQLLLVALVVVVVVVLLRWRLLMQGLLR